MVEILLLHPFVAIVDEVDAHLSDGFRWTKHSTAVRGREICYAMSSHPLTKKTTYLHREIMKPPAGMVVDHVNGDGLDNRRCNLRICTVSQNNANSRWPVGKSGFRGVHFAKDRRKWKAQISIDNRAVSIGYAATPEEAAKLYDAFAVKHFGEFATLNFPEA